VIREATLLDIVSVVYSMTDDHAKDKEAMMPGRPLDEYIAMRYSRVGLKFAHENKDGRVTMVGGFEESHPGVMTAWVIANALARESGREIIRFMKYRGLPTVLQIRHRIQAFVRAENDVGNRMMERLGFTREGVLSRFGADGSDYVAWALTRGD
jgi:hypothetical protein